MGNRGRDADRLYGHEETRHKHLPQRHRRLRHLTPIERFADLLVVGTAVDPHIDAVLSRSTNNAIIARLDVDRYPAEIGLTIKFSFGAEWPQSRSVLVSAQDRLDLSKLSAAWFRRLGRPGIARGIPKPYRQFVLGEAEQALEGVLSQVEPGRWLNSYWATRRAANKPYQYSIANAVGLTVPPLIVTNDPGHAWDWLVDHPSAIVKTLHSPVVYSDDDQQRFAFTSAPVVTSHHDLEAVGTTPCQFQDRIVKDFEVRVTSIVDRHIAVRIDTPSGSEQVLDWRQVTEECRYTLWQISSQQGAALSELLRRLDLQFAASDFIVTPDGDWIFLEANPHGAWLWLEEKVANLNITETVADYLFT